MGTAITIVFIDAIKSGNDDNRIIQGFSHGIIQVMVTYQSDSCCRASDMTDTLLALSLASAA